MHWQVMVCVNKSRLEFEQTTTHKVDGRLMSPTSRIGEGVFDRLCGQAMALSAGDRRWQWTGIGPGSRRQRSRGPGGSEDGCDAALEPAL